MHEKKETMLLDIGVWGSGSPNAETFRAVNRKTEQKLRDLQGLKCLYTKVCYHEEELYEIYIRKWYDALSKKYHATAPPTVYDKVKDGPKDGTREE